MRVLLVVVAMALAVFVSWGLRKRRPDAPTQVTFAAPAQLNRADFPAAESPWLVALFSSSTCNTCADVASKAAVLESKDVAVVNIDYVANKELHERYHIDAVPTLVIADSAGVVQQSFIGPVKAQDLWAAVANCREPGSAPTACENHQ